MRKANLHLIKLTHTKLFACNHINNICVIYFLSARIKLRTLFFFEGTAPNGQSVKLLYTIQFENINIISTHITSPSWYEVDVAVRVVAPLDCSSSVSSDGGEGCAED